MCDGAVTKFYNTSIEFMVPKQKYVKISKTEFIFK